MTADDTPGTVTICKGQGLFLRAEDAGLLLRNFHFGRARRIAWSEISHFTDGRYTKEGNTSWMLVIVLRTGKHVRVLCSVLAPVGDVVAAVREAVQSHGIPADLAGVPMKDGRPVRGFYHDPGGRAGLRHWDGRQWSPLLPPDIVPRSASVREISGSCSAPPPRDGRWTYAAVRATRRMAWAAFLAAASAVLLTVGLLTELWSGHGAHRWHMSGAGWFAFAAVTAVCASIAWERRRFFLKLDEAAKATPDSWS